MGCGETVKPVLYKTKAPSELTRECPVVPVPDQFKDDKELAVWINDVWDKAEQCREMHKALVEFVNRS